MGARDQARVGGLVVAPVQDRAQAYALGNEGKVALVAKAPDGEVRWRTELDASIGQNALMGRLAGVWSDGPLLLASTYGERGRGATSHAPALHALDKDGAVLWTWRGAHEPTSARLGRDLVVVEQLEPMEADGACRVRLTRLDAGGKPVASEEHTLSSEQHSGQSVAVRLSEGGNGKVEVTVHGISPRSGRRAARWSFTRTLAAPG